MSAHLPPFALTDESGEEHRFPGGRPALLCFVKEDCPTCMLSMPLIESAYTAFGQSVDVLVITQDEDGGEALRAAHPLTAPVLHDSALAVSYAYDLDTVPTLILTDAEGTEQTRSIGFGREDWRTLLGRMAETAGVPRPDLGIGDYPESRPGCGSRSVEPGIAERLAAEAEGSPLRARRITIGQADDPFEFLFDQGLTDGLPVIPPTPDRVLKMLSGTRRDPQSVVAVVPPNLAPATVEKIAINAVMAGCKPQYLPVVIAAVEAVCTEQFNMHGVLATTFFPGPVIIVNGPIRDRIGLNYGMSALGQGTRANLTIGRAVQLVVRNVGGGRPGDVDRATLGQPGKIAMCFAEHERRSNWEPLHVERGYRPEQSTVTVFAGGAPAGFMDQLSRGAASLAASYGLNLSVAGHPKHYGYGEVVVVVPPEHVDTFARDGWSKNQIREGIQKASLRRARDLMRDETCAEGLSPAQVERLGEDTLIPKFRSPGNIILVVAGGEAGKFGAYFHGWVSGPTGSITTTRVIEE